MILRPSRIVPALCLVLVIGCETSSRQIAEARRVETARYAVVIRQLEAAIDSTRRRCSESGAEFRRILENHHAYQPVSEPTVERMKATLQTVRLEFLHDIEAATQKHDPLKPCAALIDSIAVARQAQRKDSL